jgi:serine/threonine protein kinase
LYQRGVLHRDPSAGNILINILDSGPRGYLIDFDHSKPTDEFCECPAIKWSPGLIPEPSQDTINRVHSFFGVTNLEDVIKMAVAIVHNDTRKVCDYLGAAIDVHFPKGPPAMISVKDLEWTKVSSSGIF